LSHFGYLKCAAGQQLAIRLTGSRQFRHVAHFSAGTNNNTFYRVDIQERAAVRASNSMSGIGQPKRRLRWIMDTPESIGAPSARFPACRHRPRTLCRPV
jgi:hypothetical protein